MQAYLLTIGDELLIGQVIDTNSAWMAQELSQIGIDVLAKATVGDRHEAIIAALGHALEAADVVLMTGGLGPTKDDITKKAIADFLGVPMEFNQQSFDHVAKVYTALGKAVKDSHRAQAMTPKGAILLNNPMGTALGTWYEPRPGKILVSMPGVPFEMQAIMKEAVLPALSVKSSLRVVHHTMHTAGIGESDLAEMIEDLEDQLPSHIKLAYLPNLGMVRLRLSGKGTDAAKLEQEIHKYATLLQERLGNLIFGTGDTSIAAALGALLVERNLTVGTAESCTGGYIAHLITAVPGSSRYFEGAMLTYSNRLKHELLGVPEAYFEEYGAVSEQVVRAMAEGARKALGVDLVVATSGIMGPDGGTEEKPVGTVWMAVSGPSGTIARRIRGIRDRVKNIQYTGHAAINLMRRYLLEETQAPVEGSQN